MKKPHDSRHPLSFVNHIDHDAIFLPFPHYVSRQDLLQDLLLAILSDLADEVSSLDISSSAIAATALGYGAVSSRAQNCCSGSISEILGHFSDAWPILRCLANLFPICSRPNYQVSRIILDSFCLRVAYILPYRCICLIKLHNYGLSIVGYLYCQLHINVGFEVLTAVDMNVVIFCGYSTV